MNQVLEDLMALRWNHHYRVWWPFMKKYQCRVIAEIGIRKGENFRKLVKYYPKLAVAVDIWKDDGVVAHNDLKYTQEALDKQYQDFVDRYKSKKNIRVYRDYSTKVARKFPDNFFDFVYIDADHTYKGCYKDIRAWYPKVKKGKFLLGDDFINRRIGSGVQYGVVEAVTRFANENNLGFFVFPPNKWGIIKVA